MDGAFAEIRLIFAMLSRVILKLKTGKKGWWLVDILDSSIRVVQTVLPPTLQYFGKAKEREAKLCQTKEELAQTKAQVEVLMMKNHELGQAHAHVKVLEKENQELTKANNDLEAFKNLAIALAVIVVVVFVGMALTSERGALS
jgi:cell shape-determining protein MreC